MDPREQLIQLSADRTEYLTAAENALQGGDQAAFDTAMERVRNINGQIENVQALVREQERRMDETPASGAEQRDMMNERGNDLMQGRAVTFTANELRRGLRAVNSTTLAATTLVEPTGTGTEIRDPVGGGVSRIIDQVRVVNLDGMGGWLEPYLVSPQAAQAGAVATLAGTARAATDPTFAYAEIRPYEVNCTSFVDRNISRLSPADYFQRVYALAMEAMRRKVCELIFNGDGQPTPAMYGIKTAKNKAGAAIFTTVEAAALDEDVLDFLYYSYGDEEGAGENAQLYLRKSDLKALGTLRNSDKERIFKVSHSGSNWGIIEDGGAAYTYNLAKDLTDFATAENAGLTMLYGDPQNYELGLFGPMTVRMDESVKAVERMIAILGDAMVGGNLIRHNGFCVLKKSVS